MYYEQIKAAHDYIRNITDATPRIGIVLGTGLGNLTDDIAVESSISYSDIPHFPVATVESHQGKLLFGQLAGQSVVVMAGRLHYYEGYSMRQVTFPIRVLNMLGITQLIITNVAGSTNANINAGDLVFLKDHINLQPENPLRGDNDERLGPRFPDMLHTYNREWNSHALNIASKHNIIAHEGVYVALQGPNLETPAEYRFLNTIGGDVVGMSTVPEVLVARHGGMAVMVISVVSNKCFPIESIIPTTVADVIAVANKAEPKMRFIIKSLLEAL